MKNQIRLNIGAGEKAIPGFISIDAKFGHDATKLDYADNSVDEVYASHVLEHIHHSKAQVVVAEWVRVLKPGGRIRIAVPDMDAILDRYKTGELSSSDLSAWFHGGKDDPLDTHRAEYTVESLSTLLRVNGIEDIQPFKAEFEDWSTSPVSLNLGGYKRAVAIPRQPRVAMVLSTPRVGFIDLYRGVSETCRELGWFYEDWGGTEWGKGLTQVIKTCIDRYDPDYIMCLDYDSVFSADDCRELLRLMQENPQYGALFPVEAHRHGDLMLGMDPNRTDVNYDSGEITTLASGHFGCTIIRRQMLDNLPEPWFMSFPDPHTGEWKEKNLDADLNFWALAMLHGWTVGQANNVVIGHMELCVKWPTKTGNGIMWQPIQHYKKRGKPGNAIFDGRFWMDRIRSRNNVQSAGVNNGTGGIIDGGNNGDASVRLREQEQVEQRRTPVSGDPGVVRVGKCGVAACPCAQSASV